MLLRLSIDMTLICCPRDSNKLIGTPLTRAISTWLMITFSLSSSCCGSSASFTQ